MELWDSRDKENLLSRREYYWGLYEKNLYRLTPAFIQNAPKEIVNTVYKTLDESYAKISCIDDMIFHFVNHLHWKNGDNEKIVRYFNSDFTHV